MKKFKKELESLINRHPMENESGTPDFILADYLCSCLKAFNTASKQRTKWFGRDEMSLVPDITIADKENWAMQIVERQENPEKHKLTNKDISDQYQDIEVHIMSVHFESAFVYWAVFQNNNNALLIDKALNAYKQFLKQKFPHNDTVVKMNYQEIQDYVSEDVLASIPEILELNSLKPNIISLGALSRNMFYMILREKITTEFPK